MRTRDVLLLCLCVALCCFVVGWYGQSMLSLRSDYIEAEAMTNALSEEAEKIGARPEAKSVHYQGRERLLDSKGQAVILVNKHFKLRLSADGFLAGIERAEQGS